MDTANYPNPATADPSAAFAITRRFLLLAPASKHATKSLDEQDPFERTCTIQKYVCGVFLTQEKSGSTATDHIYAELAGPCSIFLSTVL